MKFTGPLYNDDLRAYLATADVAVAPDPHNILNDKLTMLKIPEYMTYEVPVVLYDLLEGRRSAGEAALYAKPNDPIDFAKQVELLLDSPSLRRSMGMVGRKRVEERLNWQLEKIELLRAYDSAISGCTGPPHF